MPLDGFTLRYITEELSAALVGGHMDKIQQPDKTVLLFTIRNGGRNHKLLVTINPNASRMGLTQAQYENPQEAPAFCMLLRRRLLGGHVAAVRQLGCDRVAVFDVLTEDELGERAQVSLICELTGRNSNVILCESSGRIIDAARRINASMNRVREVLPGLIYAPPPPQIKLDPFSYEAGRKVRELADTHGTARAISALLEGVGGVTAEELLARAESALGIPSADPHILFDECGVPKDVLPFRFVSIATEQQRRASMSQALEECFAARDEHERLARRTATLRKLIETNLERIAKKKAILREAVSREADIENERRLGELITANIYRIKRGMTSVVVDDYEFGGELEIPLDITKTPSQNAQSRFNKARKMKTAAKTAIEQIAEADKTQSLLEIAQQDLATCANEGDIAEVRRELVARGILRPEKNAARGKARAPAKSKPSLYLSPDGVEILVGRTSVQNDSLTQAGKGEWTWMHAKDMPGSHVIIRWDGGGEVPKETFMMALKLAAKNSRGSGGTKVPVDATLRKYVKKPSGSPPGFVIYTNQTTYYVSPT
ncbi:MAG: NFACT family protein [Oscillospiraceae bacterium]|jgi:predicted ribosome quality control (RQC) complex YloA/Tae2 family protein|nr:NFACT family protein [Oscillospiraceae bacterium]